MVPHSRLLSGVSYVRSYGSVLRPGESCAPTKKRSLGCRLIQMILALYLVPALLIVLLVGAAGILVIGVIRFLTRLLGTTAAFGSGRLGFTNEKSDRRRH